MLKNKPVISIIIVHYNIKKELFICLNSIYKSGLNAPFEIIVVDHDEQPSVERELKNKFPKVRYKIHTNTGWGDGVNAGVDIARGEYLYFLNPDTIIFPKAINNLYNFLKKDKNIGVTSSILLHENDRPHELQGSLELTPSKAIVVYSFMNKFLSMNKIKKAFWPFNVNTNKPTRVETAPLTAALMRKDVFIKAGKFDKRFFLYFEEYDLGKRLQKMGLKSYIVPNSKVIHLWGQSTKGKKGINKIFAQSRFRYFKKYYGLIPALLTEGFLRINKTFFILLSIIGVGAFLRLSQINTLMPFIGDQGWFYLSARDIILTGQIPLVGIASSHPWLHQGALWTYLLALTFKFFGFNPVNGAYLSILIDIIAIFSIYKLGGSMFSKKIGLISAVLYATSPLVIFNARMPYHTSPIPLFSILFIFFLYKWINGNKYYFPFIISSLALLYNLEIATSIFSAIVVLFLTYGIFKKKVWATEVFKFKFLILSCIAFTIPMLPMIIYDLNHGFPQTLGFIAWLGYKLLNTVGILNIHSNITTNSWMDLITFFNLKLSRLLFSQSIIISLFIYLSSLIYVFIKLIKQRLDLNIGIIAFLNLFILLGLFIAKTPSDAYMPMLFAPVIILISYFINTLLNIKKLFILVILIFVLLLVSNIFFLVNNNYLIGRDGGFGPPLEIRKIAVKEIIKKADQQKYNLIGKGDGSQFESFTMNYEYLTWLLGNPPQKEKQSITYSVSEKYDSVIIR